MTSATDTIAAVSTPRGKGGVALIRISGPDAAEIGRKIFIPRGKHPDERPRYAVLGEAVFPEGSPRAGEPVDSCLATFFSGPASFTGEDTLEISCHGGVLVTRTLLLAALEAGARQAEPGEFTRRAFASGRISLPEAEALGMLLDAGTDAQLRLSRSGMSGRLTSEITAMRGEITSLLTDLYARIDFPEEDLGSIPDGEVTMRAAKLLEDTEKLASSYRTGKAIAEGIKTVICGRTNVGKSTLFNRLTGSDDAIVTDVAGTTRDVLTGTVSLGGVTLRLCDTAGIREGSGDMIENIGIKKARERIADAELVLFLIDSSSPPDADDISLAGSLREKSANGTAVIALLSKSDLDETDKDAEDLWCGFEHKLRISAETGFGIELLGRIVADLFTDRETDPARDPVVCSARQYDALRRAAGALSDAVGALREGHTADVVSVCLEDAAEALAELDGRGRGTVSADVIDGIFSKFCVGK